MAHQVGWEREHSLGGDHFLGASQASSGQTDSAVIFLNLAP